MNGVLDAFNTSPFTMIELTDAINKLPFVPGRVGALGLFDEKGVTTTSVMLEEKDGVLSLIPTTPRGAPPRQVTGEKRKARSLVIPHLEEESIIYADEVQGVREFGSTNQTRALQSEVNARNLIMSRNLDATLEHHRVGAVKGIVSDADGSTVLYNLFDEFGVSQVTEIDFNLDNASPDNGAVRNNCNVVLRTIEDELGAAPYTYVHALVGSTFFDQLVAHPETAKAYERWNEGEFFRQRTARRSFWYAGILFEEYRGKVGSVNFVADTKAHFFPVGVPGLFKTYFGPADFIETVNTIGLPRYVKPAIDTKYGKWASLLSQSNPLNICTRPRVLLQGRNT